MELAVWPKPAHWVTFMTSELGLVFYLHVCSFLELEAKQRVVEDMRLALTEQEETQSQMEQVLEDKVHLIQELSDGQTNTCSHSSGSSETFFVFFAALTAVCHVDRQLAQISSVWSPDCIVKFISPLDVCSRDSLFFSFTTEQKILILTDINQKNKDVLSTVVKSWPQLPRRSFYPVDLFPANIREEDISHQRCWLEWRFDSTVCILIYVSQLLSTF